MADLLAGRDFDYVVGSIHFVGDGALDYDSYDIWIGGELAREGVAHVLRVARRGGARAGCSTSSPTPTSSSTGAAPSARGPSGDLRRYYEIAMEGIAESGIAVEVSTAGLRKPVGELYPARAFLEMVLDAGNPIALSSDAHAPERPRPRLRPGARAARGASASPSSPSSSGRERRLEPIG